MQAQPGRPALITTSTGQSVCVCDWVSGTTNTVRRCAFEVVPHDDRRSYLLNLAADLRIKSTQCTSPRFMADCRQIARTRRPPPPRPSTGRDVAGRDRIRRAPARLVGHELRHQDAALAVGNNPTECLANLARKFKGQFHLRAIAFQPLHTAHCALARVPDGNRPGSGRAAAPCIPGWRSGRPGSAQRSR